MIQAGGNAVDAAIAANAVLNVVYPILCGTGGDVFMMIYDAESDSLYGLDGSGGAGSLATPDWFRAHGYSSIPQRGPLAVSVPGVVDGWQMASERFGRLGLARCMQPAIGYAETGVWRHTAALHLVGTRGCDGLAPRKLAGSLPSWWSRARGRVPSIRSRAGPITAPDRRPGTRRLL